MKTKLPSGIVYGWNRLGKYHLRTTLHLDENLNEDVIAYSLYDKSNIDIDKKKYDPDIVIFLKDKDISEIELANDILIKSNEQICKNQKPYFSIFTSAFNTKSKIIRTYESLKNQIFEDWEWTILDDSKDDETWKIILELSESDVRIKPHKIFPFSNGNIGLVKNRTASLSSGVWLVELDHDDELLDNCLLECFSATKKYPNSEFFYSDFCEVYEDGTMKSYDHKTENDWYARADNRYAFGYAGNVWEIYKDKKYLRHHFCDINPLTIRYNISMPNHVRVWKKSFYDRIGGHNKSLPVADDFELIIRTFLETKITHIKKMLYVQWNNNNSTVDNNSIDINRRCRMIKDFYDKKIHDRILELGCNDWYWDYENNKSFKLNMSDSKKLFHENECVLNYVYE
jgi:glycosyltransferase involved in cell wall biosynthesis